MGGDDVRYRQVGFGHGTDRRRLIALNCEREVNNTRVKLARLEARFEAAENATTANPRGRKLTLISPKRLISPFKEEVARIEARQGRARPAIG